MNTAIFMIAVGVGGTTILWLAEKVVDYARRVL